MDENQAKPKKKLSGCKIVLIVLLAIILLIAAAVFIFFKVHEDEIKDMMTTVQSNVTVGQDAGEFEVTTTDGEKVTMSSLLENKDALVVVLFATWCGPCEKEFPFMSDVYKENQDRMAMIGLDIDTLDDEKGAKEYAKSHNLAFPIAYLDNPPADYTTYTYPTTMVIDRNGKIQFCRIGSISTKEDFEKIVSTFVGDNYQERQLGYYSFYGVSNKKMVPGIEFSVTSEEGTETYVTGENGLVNVFTEKPQNLKIKVLSVPEGCEIDGTGEVESGIICAPIQLPVK